MKEITLNVQEEKFQFFLELMAQLDFVEINDDVEVPEFHKKTL